MKNVVPIFTRKNAEIALTEAEISVSKTHTNMLESERRLGQIVKELSTQFEAIETAVDTIDDTATRNRLKDSTELSRETLSKAVLKLSQQIEHFLPLVARESAIGTFRPEAISQLSL